MEQLSFQNVIIVKSVCELQCTIAVKKDATIYIGFNCDLFNSNLLKLPYHFDILVYIFLNTVFFEGSEIHSHSLLCSTLMHKVTILFWQASLCNMFHIIPSYLRGRFVMNCIAFKNFENITGN